jgi:hypothetical protein
MEAEVKEAKFPKYQPGKIPELLREQVRALHAKGFLDDIRPWAVKGCEEDDEDYDDEDDFDLDPELEENEVKNPPSATDLETATPSKETEHQPKKKANPEASKPDREKEPEPDSEPQTDGQITIEEFQRIVHRANKGHEKSLQQMKHLLDLNPSIWEQVGDLGAHAELALINLVAEGNVLAAESLKRYIVAMKIGLAGSSPTPLERLAIQRVTACWLHCQLADKGCVNADSSTGQQRFWARRQEIAERRFQVALKSLKLVQELPGPSTPDLSGVAVAADQGIEPGNDQEPSQQAENASPKVTPAQPCQSANGKPRVADTGQLT